MAKNISDAYPPDIDEEVNKRVNYIADVHTVLKDFTRDRIKELKTKVRYSTQPRIDDVPQLKDLHKEFFPIDYHESFYQMILQRDLGVFNCYVTIDGSLPM